MILAACAAPVEEVEQAAAVPEVPPEVPRFTREGDADPLGLYLVTSTMGTSNAALVLDPDGEVVWWHLDELLIPRARLSHDGRHVIYNAVSMDPDSGLGEVVWVPVDGSAPTRVPVPLLTHDWVERPDGVVVATVWDERDGWLGDALVEVTRDGVGDELWNAWDDFPEAPTAADGTWTHANALDYVDGTYVLGLRNYDRLLVLDEVGSTLATLAGSFEGQHQFELADDSLLVFDNGSIERYASRIVDYDLDGDVLSPRWEWQDDPARFVYAMGDVARDERGGIRVIWGTLGRVDWIEGDTPYASLHAPFGRVFGYGTWEDPARLPGSWRGG